MKLEPPYIQLAIDVTDFKKALRLARIASKYNNVIIEIGTPLLKAQGKQIIYIFSQLFPDSIILVDTKTMDAGAIEAELVFENGGNIMTVLGVALDETIISAVKTARKHGGLVQVDMINVTDPLARAKEVSKYDVNIVGLHAGIDAQSGKKFRAIDMADLLEKISNEIRKNTLLSIAGGIKPGEVPQLLNRGADIVVIGSAITASENPEMELEKAVSALERAKYER